MSGELDRRGFLRAGLSTAALLPFAPLLGLAGCERDAAPRPAEEARAPGGATRRPLAGPAREVRLLATTGEVEIAPGRVVRTWLFNGEYPGPEIRIRQGERLRVTLENRLPEPTTVHWHGLPVPNGMDGVPGVTQEPVPPGGTFVYDFSADPPGTYLYHSHAGLQLDRGLVGPLIVEAPDDDPAYDREHTIVLDDALAGEPRPAEGRGPGMGMMGGHRMGRSMRGGIMGMRASDPARPTYAAHLVNGRPAADPPTFDVRRGERVRLRILNAGSATTFRLAIAGHRMAVTHADGRPLEPVTVDALVLGSGERYDVLVDADEPGVWPLVAASITGEPKPGVAILRYLDAAETRPPEGQTPAGLTGGRVLALRDLVAREVPVLPGPADRRYDLTLSGGMMMQRGWSIDGERYPDAAPLDVKAGERVEVRLTNMSMAHHPMHLHGHFFRVERAVKDTVLVPPHMGRVTFTFVADNPGDWFFHCHNLYHMESGMARVFRYR